MSSDGPYGRHGFNANPSGYGGGAGSYANPPQGGYAAPSYGGPPPGAGYAAPGSGGYGGPADLMVRTRKISLVLAGLHVVPGGFLDAPRAAVSIAFAG